MSGVHDVGGKLGYGAPKLSTTPVVDSTAVTGSAFAARWEAAVFAMMGRLGARGVMKNTDQFRHAVERVDPTNYFAHGYYGRWLGGLETLLVEAGELDRETLDARVGELARAAGATTEQVNLLVAEANVASRPRPAAAVDQVDASVNAGSSVRYLPQSPRFAVGQAVRTLPGAEVTSNQPRHTRLPGYARGCLGEVIAWHCGWVLPDTNAHGDGEMPCHLYTVAFGAQALFGPTAEAGVVVHLDLFEPYLELAATP